MHGVHSQISSVGPCGLIRDHSRKLAPRDIVDALSQASILDQVLDPEVLDGNDTEFVDDTSTLLMGKAVPFPASAFMAASLYLAALLAFLPSDPFFGIVLDHLSYACFIDIEM